MNDDLLPCETSDPHVEAAWAEEIRRRVRAFRAGEMKMIPLEQALAEADRILAEEPD